MVSASDILIRIKGQDQTGGAFKSVESKAKGMQGAMSSAFGMVAGMVGYDLINSLSEAGREAINASQNLDYFGGRLGLSAQQTEEFRGKIDDLQKDFRKVDMTAVGASAEEIILKSNGAISATSDNLANVTKMTATMSSAFVKEGRTQEEAILAVNDALGGQFKRLQELNISEDMLKANGWSGELSDQIGLINALNKTFDQMGYTQTAQDIVTLDDAWQALTVSGGRLLADVVVPLTPAFVAVTDAIVGAIDFVKDNGWAQGAALIGALSVAVILLGGSLVTAEGAFIGWSALMPGFITSLYGAASGFMAISVAGAPLWAILAVLAAVALAVYEIGIYFGWWSDVGSMLAAISAGVQRLWSAFINSPIVQQAIQNIRNSFQMLWNFLQPFVSWISSAFSNMFGDAGSSPDVVRAIIDAFGQLGNAAMQVFTFMSNLGSQVASALAPITAAMSRILGIFASLINGEMSIEQAFMGLLQNFSIIFSQIGMLAARAGRMILSGILSGVRAIGARVWGFLMQVVLRLLLFANLARARAVNAGRAILNGIITFIRQLPGRVGAFMMQVPARIASAAGAAVGAAASLASQVVQAVVSGVTGVADAVYNEFVNIGSRINQSVSSAVSAAASFGSDIKNAVLGALGIASPGIIQKKIAIEFQDIPGRIGESNDYVYSAARDYAGNIMRGFNAPQIPLGTVRQNANYTPRDGGSSNVTIVHVHENAVPIDARNMTKREAQSVITLAFESIGKDPEGTGV